MSSFWSSDNNKNNSKPNPLNYSQGDNQLTRKIELFHSNCKKKFEETHAIYKGELNETTKLYKRQLDEINAAFQAQLNKLNNAYINRMENMTDNFNEQFQNIFISNSSIEQSNNNYGNASKINFSNNFTNPAPIPYNPTPMPYSPPISIQQPILREIKLFTSPIGYEPYLHIESLPNFTQKLKSHIPNLQFVTTTSIPSDFSSDIHFNLLRVDTRILQGEQTMPTLKNVITIIFLNVCDRLSWNTTSYASGLNLGTNKEKRCFFQFKYRGVTLDDSTDNKSEIENLVTILKSEIYQR